MLFVFDVFFYQIQFKKVCEDAMIAHLQDAVLSSSQMVRPKRTTVWDEKASLGKLKVGDWVEVEYNYQPGTCSDGGVGVVIMLEDAISEYDGECPPEEAQKGRTLSFNMYHYLCMMYHYRF